MRHRPSRLICRIDVTGFLAIMLFLYFLLAVPVSMPVHSRGIFVDLPKATHTSATPEAAREDALIVAIYRDGKIFFDAQQVTLDELTSMLRDRTRSHEPRIVFIRADSRVIYLSVEQVLQSVRAAGLEKVVFLAEQKRKPGSL